MKKLLGLLFFALPVIASANIYDFENESKTCYIFHAGRLTYQTACQATGTVGTGLDYVINEVSFSSGVFGRIDIVNNINQRNQKHTTINNLTASTQYRHPQSHQIIATHMVNRYLSRGDKLLQCIKSQDERLELCTVDLLQV